MLLATFRGNLGSDVQTKVSNGRTFYVFNVAVSKRYRGADGVVKESTQWISCVMNECSEDLRKYLVRGQQVVVVGDCDTRVYSSPKERRMVAGIDCHVRLVELCSGPRKPLEVVDKDGVVFSPLVAYEIPFGVSFSEGDHFQGNDGFVYVVNNQGRLFLAPAEEQ